MKKTIIILICLLTVLSLAGCMKKPVKPNLSQNASDNTAYAQNEENAPFFSRSVKGINLVTSAKSLYGGILKAFGKIGKNGKPIEFKKSELITAMIIGGSILIVLLVIFQNRPKKYSAPKGRYQS